MSLNVCPAKLDSFVVKYSCDRPKLSLRSDDHFLSSVEVFQSDFLFYGIAYAVSLGKEINAAQNQKATVGEKYIQ
jgi:hypothetical protein